MNGPADLWAITSYFNPARYRRRLANYRVFRRHLGVPLLAVELSFGPDFDLQPEDADVLVQLQGGDVMWQKERLLNIALAALPGACRKVVWLDCDMIFGAEDWARLVSNALDICPLVQPFSRVALLSSEAQVSDTPAAGDIECWRPAVAAKIAEGHAALDSLSLEMPVAQSFAIGYGWAARRDLLDRHGFYDPCIIGNGNHAMICAAYGCFDVVIQRQAMNTQQRGHYLAWAELFFQAVRGAVGCADSSIFHLWHGAIVNRRYRERLLGIQPFQFDPVCDIAPAESGAWRWNSDKPLLHQYVKDYFAARKEDG